MTRLLLCVVGLLAALTAGPGAASAMTIERIVSPAGIEAWLVREKAVPLVTLNYAFHEQAVRKLAGEIAFEQLAHG